MLLNGYCRVFVSAMPRCDKIGAFRVYTGLDESNETDYLLVFSARVAELVDALDLGSSAPSAWGFNSPLSHHDTKDCRLLRPTDKDRTSI